jgi:hypothetical protein
VERDLTKFTYSIQEFSSRTSVLAAVLFIILLAYQASAMSPRRSEEGKVRVLYIGEPLGSRGAFRYMLQDPFFDLTPVQAFTWLYDEETVQRSVRKYMPRRYSELVERYDVISLVYAHRHAFKDKTIRWLRDAVVDDGLGMCLAGSRRFYYQDWLQLSLIGEVMPVEATKDGPVEMQCRIRALVPENPLMVSLPWSSIGGHGSFAGFNPVKVKAGAEALAMLETPFGSGNPGLVWWDVGEGRSVTGTAHYVSGDNPFLDWEFFPDYGSNILLFVADVGIPPDHVIIHRIRNALWNLRNQRSLLVPISEFISKLGGNPTPVEAILNQVNGQRRDVDRMYLAYDFEGSLRLTNQLGTDLEGAIDLAYRIKDKTIFWIYMVEWSVLTGTSMVTGFIVWGLMVKRRLYREVRTTRLTKQTA